MYRVLEDHDAERHSPKTNVFDEVKALLELGLAFLGMEHDQLEELLLDLERDQL